jgi:hypothetical protein
MTQTDEHAGAHLQIRSMMMMMIMMIMIMMMIMMIGMMEGEDFDWPIDGACGCISDTVFFVPG